MYTQIENVFRCDLVDVSGVQRVAGEEWMHRGCGSYLPAVHEQVVQVVDGITLTPNKALHVRAEVNLVDGTGRKR